MSLKNILKVADYYNVKYSFDKKGEKPVIQSQEGDKVPKLLFGDKDFKAKDAKFQNAFGSEVSKFNETLKNLDEKYDSFVQWSAFPKIVVSSQNSGTITPEVEVTCSRFYGDDENLEAKKFKADPEVIKLSNELKNIYDITFKRVSGKSLQDRAKEVSNKNEFYSNLDSSGKGYLFKREVS